MTVPKPLLPGARVALVAPASAVPVERLQPALDGVAALGFKPVAYPSCFYSNRDGYLAADDRQRAADINSAFADPDIDGILCIRGGYGSHRILPLLDTDTIRANPKYFSGYSDVTALLTYLNQVCGLECYHTIMPSTEYYEPIDDYSMGYLKKALFGTLTGPLENPPGQPFKVIQGGTAEGPLCGGNLSLLAASLGTPWEIDTCGKILFLEDIGEKTYRVDGMLTQLRNGGKFDQCAGVLLGCWTDCPPEDPEKTLTLEEIFTQLILPAGKPVVMDLACGHCLPTMALPMGRRCALDGDAGTITLA